MKQYENYRELADEELHNPGYVGEYLNQVIRKTPEENREKALRKALLDIAQVYGISLTEEILAESTQSIQIADEGTLVCAGVRLRVHRVSDIGFLLEMRGKGIDKFLTERGVLYPVGWGKSASEFSRDLSQAINWFSSLANLLLEDGCVFDVEALERGFNELLENIGWTPWEGSIQITLGDLGNKGRQIKS